MGAVVIAGARSSTSPPPELLLERAAAADVEAFDVLIRPRLDKLFRMAIAITRNDTDARDAVQEACVSAWRQLPKLRDHDRFDPWLAQILVNACRPHAYGHDGALVRSTPTPGFPHWVRPRRQHAGSRWPAMSMRAFAPRHSTVAFGVAH